MYDIVVNASVNAWMRSNAPDTVEDASSALYVGIAGSSVRRALVSFDLSGLPSADPESAFLTLWQTNAGVQQQSVYRTLAAWDGTATWNSRVTVPSPIAWAAAGGDYEPGESGVLAPIGVNKQISADVLALFLAARAASATMLHLLIRRTVESSPTETWVQWSSIGGAVPPKLQLTYSPGLLLLDGGRPGIARGVCIGAR